MKAIQYTFMVMLISVLGQPLLHGQTSNQNYMITRTSLNASGTNVVQSVQYYDGLGRESVLAQGGVNTYGKYVYGMTEYDLLGREAKIWLPAVGTTSADMIDVSTMSTRSQSTYGGDTYAFSETTYDALGRPTFVSTPGDAWYQAGKGVTTEYKTNAANSVKRYVVTSPTTCAFTQDGYYAPGMLTCVKTTDEDGKRIEVYKDLMERVILERRGSNNDTYYLYYKGLLSVVLPPLYQTQENDDLIYQYKYDNLGRCTSKTLPGCDPISYWYDSGSRVSFIRDARISNLGKYRFFLYDGLGRMVVQGLCTNGSIGDARLAKVTFDHTVQGLCGTGYVLQSGYSLSNPEIEIVNYYDGYDCLQTYAISPYVNQYNLQVTPTTCATTLLTAQIVAVSNGGRQIRVMYYDEKGQLINERSSQLNGIAAQKSITYTFTGKPITINESVTKNNTTRAVVQQNTYDTNTDQLLTRTHKFKDASAVNTGSFAYDDLGRLDSVSRYLNRTSVRYAYDLHGWLTNIHGQDHYHNALLFDEKIQYADGSRTHLYNGNISYTKYTTPDYPMGQGNQCVYEYSYDGLNRLTGALFGYCPVNTNNNTFTSYFSENMTYDANSNITSLMRYGKHNNGNYSAIDILNFTYDGNRLYSIIDHGVNLVTEGAFDFKDDLIDSFYAPEYGYDNNGSLTYDANKGVSWINYDQWGNPIRVQFTDHSITEHVYTADGRRLKTIHRTSIPQSNPLGIGVTASLTPAQTQSIDSIDYVGSFIYEKGQLKRYMFDDGYLKLYTNTFSPRFFIKDHLGNNRIVTDGSGNIQQNTNYYPYGGMTYISTNQGEQQFKYNGKEYDPMHGLNEYDYGARQYDPAIGKFTTMDPLCEKYYHISPYAYCFGNPVMFLDPNGEAPSKEEAARMAMHVTGRWGNWILSGGWELDKEKEHLDLIKNNFGLKSQLYVRKIDGKNEYAYVTAGTDFFSAEDWLNNILQLVGQSPQYKEATENAKRLVKKLGRNVMTFVGFSLGGGLASANALKTGKNAITFNAAGLSEATIKKLELYDQKGTIDAYVVRGEILDNAQRHIGLKAEGNIKYMPSMCLPLSPELLLLQPIISHDINLINAYYYIKDLLK